MSLLGADHRNLFVDTRAISWVSCQVSRRGSASTCKLVTIVRRLFLGIFTQTYLR